MGIIHDIPLVLGHHFLNMNLVAFHPVAPLYHVPTVHTILENGRNCHSPPQRTLIHVHLGILVFQPQTLPLVERGTRNPVVIQVADDGIFALAIQEHGENIPDNRGGLLVNH